MVLYWAAIEVGAAAVCDFFSTRGSKSFGWGRFLSRTHATIIKCHKVIKEKYACVFSIRSNMRMCRATMCTISYTLNVYIFIALNNIKLELAWIRIQYID
jgi:hypothetical protein